MATSAADLLTLQGNIKRDPEGYKDEFLLQWRHYNALMEVFKLKPSKDSREFGELVNFISQVCKCYPAESSSFADQVMELLDQHYAVLDTGLRKLLVQALILLRNRSQLEPGRVLPLFFRLFRCQDKALRRLLFRHIITDIKNSNKKHRNEKLNRSLQNFMYSIIADDNEAAAKKSLAVCTELWRRHVWRDARTVNVIASAAFHKASRVMLAVMKFFLGQDKDDDASDDEGSEDDGKTNVSAPSKEDIYKAAHKGTRCSKKKKQAKLKRVMNTVRKQARAKEASSTESFAAIHLLHDPQTFAERVFSRMQNSNERFETRMAMMSVVSRVIGVHKLLVLNFYPFLQKYIAPHQRDVPVVLAAMVQACHDLVPPDTLQPVLRQLVDQFVHDRARPEVMTIGLKTVREMCLRCPLIMEGDLLQDLAAYKKFRDKEVSSAARGLIGVFRDLNPELLAKKDRGRAADIAAKPKAYGQVDVAQRVEGAALLEQALLAGQGSDEDDYRLSSSDDDDSEDGGSEDEEEGSDSEDEEEGSKRKRRGKSSGAEAAAGSEGGEEEEDEDEEGDEGEQSSSDEFETDEEGEGEGVSGSEDEGEGEDEGEEASSSGSDREDSPAPKKALQPKQDSLSSLKKKLAEAKARKAAREGEGDDKGSSRGVSVTPGVPIEMDRILGPEDFERIKRLQHKALIESAMAKHGLKSMSAARKRRLLEAAEADAEERLEMQGRQGTIQEHKVNPENLVGKHKRRKDKEERMASVLAGREGREKFGGSSGLKKNKTGSMSEKEKQKKKIIPLAARLQQLKRRSSTNKIRKAPKNFKGHVRG